MGYYNSYILNNTLYCDQSDDTCVISDRNARTICQVIRMIDCTGNPDNPCGLAIVNNGLILCSPNDSWNCNLCPNDLPYYNVVSEDDKLYFQFQQIDTLNGQDPNGAWTYGWGSIANPDALVGAVIRDCCTGEPLQNDFNVDLEIGDVQYLTGFVGVYPVQNYDGSITWINIQQNQIDMNLLAPYLQSNSTDCFYIEFVFKTDDGPSYSLYTEPYKLEHCENTIVLEGSGTGTYKNCFGFWTQSNTTNLPFNSVSHGWGTLVPYLWKYRIKGFFELMAISVKKEFVGTYQNTVSTELSKVYSLKTNRIPERIATMVAYMISSSNFFVNGFEYVVDGEIEKNNEVGNQWFLEVQMRSVKCSQAAGGCN